MNLENLSITRATTNDIVEVHEFGLTIPELKVSSQVEFMTEDELRSTLSNPGSVAFVAWDQRGKLQGFCLGQTGDPDHCIDPTQACLVYIAVAEKWRGSNLATALYRYVVNELKKRGVTYLYTWASPTSGATKFFSKQGMVAGRTCVWMDLSL